ncbi:MAG: aspartate/glutamate racemase family protein [Pyramidobacter sp.]|nr:aspartate/glutamate racemase family protein [Pyramidobacter sp.]
MRPEKILGVYGGMGPAASAEFLRLLAAMAPAKKDQEHPSVYVSSNAQTPDRTAAFFGRGESPAKHLREGLDRLCDWGADLLAVPCNTAHIFIDEFRGELKKPLVHIVEATIDDAVKASPEGCWIIATGATLASGIYAEEARRRGYTLFDVDETVRDMATEAIRLVKAGEMPASGKVMDGIGEKLWKTRRAPIITACTELPLAYDASSLPPEMGVSSLKSLSRACIEALYQGNS